MTSPNTKIDGSQGNERLSLVNFTQLWILLVALFAIALILDIPVAGWVHENGISAWLKAPTGHQLTLLIRFPGRAYYTVTVCLILIVMALKHHRAAVEAALVALASLFSGINTVIKWLVGRTRPFHDVGDIHNIPAFHLIPFRGGLHGILFAEQNLSFPSGDASLAFAMAASMVMIFPRYSPIWWGLGIMVAAERVFEGAHYPSDVVAGAALGIAAAIVARSFVRGMRRQQLVN